ncbi:MAG: M48 family metalloprotease [Bacteroidetes bacterium]|nr:M48 family metalloprotease [Bacteroidota bacterium]
MKATLNVFSDEMLTAIGFSLLHSLWQAALVALIVLGLLRLFQNGSATSRYFIAFTGLAAMALLPVITFIGIYQPTERIMLSDHSQEAATLANVIYVLADSQLGIESVFDKIAVLLTLLAPKVFWFWIIGMTLMAIRMSGGYFLTYKLKNSGLLPVSGDWETRLQKLASMLHIHKKIKLFESSKADVPMVIGFLKPVILIPVGTISRIPFDQLEMILAHELAHIKRADFLVNLLQSVVETIMFFNPFIWWISGIIRQERENICDDLALQTSGKRISLAKALATLSSNQTENVHLNTVVYFNKFNTMKRIERLFKNPKLKPSPTERMAVVALSLALIMLVSASGILTGSNSENNYDSTIDESFSSMPLVGILPSEMKKPDSFQDTLKKKKTIEVEMEDGKPVKMVIDGKEVPQEELESKNFIWKDNDSTITKKIIVKQPGKKYETMIIETDAIEFTMDNEDKTSRKPSESQKKVIRMKSMRTGDNDSLTYVIEATDMPSDSDFFANGKRVKKMNIPNGGEMIFIDSEVFDGKDFSFDFDYDFNFDFDSLKVNVNRNREKVLKQEEYVKQMETTRFHMTKQAEELSKRAEKMHQEASRLAMTDKESEVKMEALRRQAEELEKIAGELQFHSLELPEAPPFPIETERQIRIRVPDQRFSDGKAESLTRQHHQLLRQEMVQNGVANSRSTIILSKKQLIIDEKVADKKDQRNYLQRFEQISGRKLESNEAVRIR